MTQYGTADGENPPLLHRASVLSGRSQCGKRITVAETVPELPHCEACGLMDKTGLYPPASPPKH
jgi:hypothetical protein